MVKQTNEQIFAVIVPSAASLTAPIAAGIELSKLFIMSSNKVQQLAEQTRVISTVDENGEEIISIIDHPDLKWWFDQTRRIASDVAKITANLQIKEVETRVKIADMVLTSNLLPKEYQEKMVQEYYKLGAQNAE